MQVLGPSDSYLIAASKLYAACSHKPLPDALPLMSTHLRPSLECVYGGASRECPDLTDDGSTFHQPDRVYAAHAVVGVAGGKDSLAAALVLRDEGYDLTFVHVRGINPAYPGEADAAREQAAALGARFTEVSVRIGKKEYVDNPARNHAILLVQASVAARLGAGLVVQGLHTQRAAASQPFDTGWSDCREMGVAGQRTLAGVAPWLMNRLTNLPESDTESLDCVVHRAPQLLHLVRSCMQPLRYHRQVREANRRKAGYDLLPGRCGSCYKCCREWIVLREYGYYPEAPTYRKHVERLLVDNHAVFCYGPAAATWSRERVLRTFLARPTGRW